MRVVGLISGTSFDGVDAAVAELSLHGEEVRLRPLGATTVPYPAHVRGALEVAMPPAATTAAALCALDTRIGQVFADVAATVVAELADGRADLVVSHGQTLYHWVEDRQVLGTLQVGQPAWIAERTGLSVVADIRSRDVAAGGQGAPLASLLDVLLLGGAGEGEVPAALNLGGIANLTVLAPSREPVAFDVGPANALLDAAVGHFTQGQETFDRDGQRGARGRIDEHLLARLRADPYYALPAPKSTGKEYFHLPYLLGALEPGDRLEPDDVVATVTSLTAATVADACRAHGVTSVVASGGGTANPTLMGRLRAELPSAEVTTIERLGVPSDAKEAYAFALMGFLTVHGLPGTVASCTGASHATVLGALLPGARGFVLPPAAPIPPTRLRVMTERGAP